MDSEEKPVRGKAVSDIRVIAARFLVTFGVCFLFVDSAGAGKSSDRERDGFLGLVKTVHTETARIFLRSGTWVEGPREPSESTTYDLQGNKTVESVHYPDTAMDFTSVYTYDAQGNLTHGAEFDARGSLVFKWVYAHDPERGRIEEARYNAEGSLFSKTVYTYDVRGNLSEESRYGADSSLESRWVYTYDASGNKVEEAFYVSRVTGLRDTTGGSPNFKSVYTYDAKGNMIEQARYGADGSLVFNMVYTYEFDSTGNWVKRIMSERITQFGKSDLKPSEVTYRTITYYFREATMP